MTDFRSLRISAAVFMIAALSACQTTTMPASPQNAERPISVEELTTRFLAANTDRTRVPLVRYRNQGFVINADSTMTYYALRSNLEETTMTTLIDGNRICMSENEHWSGACLTLTLMSDNRIRVIYEFGNNRGGSFLTEQLQL